VELTETATAPFTFVWQRNGSPLVTNVTSLRLEFLTLTDLQAADAGLYSVRVADAANTHEESPPAGLTLLPDADGDGMPDDFELLHGLAPADPLDADRDTDGDGASNLEEYLAGTDPTQAVIVLKLAAILDPGGGLRLHFAGAMNRTYGLMAASALDPATGRIIAVYPAVSDTPGQFRHLDFLDQELGTLEGQYYWVVCPAPAGSSP
jgi:hypothetical protein